MATEMREEVQAVRVRLICEKCMKEMQSSSALLTHPVQYVHHCPGCGNTTRVIGKSYPYIEYVAVQPKVRPDY